MKKITSVLPYAKFRKKVIVPREPTRTIGENKPHKSSYVDGYKYGIEGEREDEYTYCDYTELDQGLDSETRAQSGKIFFSL